MSQHVSTPANAADHDPVLGSATEFSLSGGSGCTCGNEEIRKSLQKELESMHKARVDMLDEHIKDLEMVKLAKEFAINAVKERLEQEMAEKDATNQRSLDCVRQFWHEARLGRSVEADRAWKLDANLTKKTTECEDLATTNANLKRVLASVEANNTELLKNEEKAKEGIAKYNQEIESLKKKSTMQKIVIALQVLVLGVVVGRRHF